MNVCGDFVLLFARELYLAAGIPRIIPLQSTIYRNNYSHQSSILPNCACTLDGNFAAGEQTGLSGYIRGLQRDASRRSSGSLRAVRRHIAVLRAHTHSLSKEVRRHSAGGHDTDGRAHQPLGHVVVDGCGDRSGEHAGGRARVGCTGGSSNVV